MARMLAIVAAGLLAASAWGAHAQAAAAVAGEDAWQKLVVANDLELEGKGPFDLGMTVQLYDLDGKPTETGTVEEWWEASSARRRVVVHVVGLNEDGSAPEGADPVVVRDAYLVRQLLEAAGNFAPPKPRIAAGLATIQGELVTPKANEKLRESGEVVTKSVKFGKITLDCTSATASNAMNRESTTLCTAPQSTDAVLLEGLDGDEMAVRSRTAKFEDTYVALDLSINYLGRDAIDGKLTVMRAWDPAAASVKLPPDVTAKAAEPTATRVQGGVTAGHRVTFVEPEYPEDAKVQHRSGTVLLSAIIGKDGKIGRLVPLASTSPTFSESAIKAVKGWTYAPFLLNGAPTTVDTTITVNFRMNP